MSEAEEELNLGLLLFIPYRFMESAVMAALRARGHDIGLSQARVFQRIDPAGSRLAELAEAAQVSKQTVGSIVDQLERAGYVERLPDPSDGRARLVRLTPPAEAPVPTARSEEARIEAEWEAHLGAERMAQLREALTTLREITDRWRPS